jgi:thiosulfate/3-mercaptopyruvate sulfurtransferase
MPERYRGDIEPLDPVAGHIPGAINSPYSEALDAGGYFLPPHALKQRYEEILKGRSAADAVAYCGSGVTAAHVLLAFDVAGLPGARLYAGSWSEWITDSSRPVALGSESSIIEEADGR